MFKLLCYFILNKIILKVDKIIEYCYFVCFIIIFENSIIVCSRVDLYMIREVWLEGLN